VCVISGNGAPAAASSVESSAGDSRAKGGSGGSGGGGARDILPSPNLISMSIRKRIPVATDGADGMAAGAGRGDTGRGEEETETPVVCSATVGPIVFLSASVAAGMVLPAAYVWSLAVGKLSRSLQGDDAYVYVWVGGWMGEWVGKGVVVHMCGV